MTFELLRQEFSVCRLPLGEPVWPAGEIFFFARTADEVSLVCETQDVPQNAEAAEHDWRALRVAGVLAFSMVGVLAEITAILAQAGISVFVVSTFNTDYVLVRGGQCAPALQALEGVGHVVLQ